MKYLFDNPTKNKYLKKYNKLVKKYEKNIPGEGLSFHHIMPRSKFPELKDDPNNHLYLPVLKHIKMHYLLWKYDSSYCAAFWFCYVWAHKNHHFNISKKEFNKLKNDMKIYRKTHK